MGKEPHIQWAFYDIDHYDYYVSLNKETLNKIKEWSIIKSKIVFLAEKENDLRNLTQKKLFISLLTDEDRIKNRSETKFIHSHENVWLKISNRLLNILIEGNPEDYEHRYDAMWNKIHFLIANSERPLSDKWWFDNTFKSCERLNKKGPTSWDLFESAYINVYK
jgi:hypothetical protein